MPLIKIRKNIESKQSGSIVNFELPATNAGWGEVRRKRDTAKKCHY